LYWNALLKVPPVAPMSLVKPALPEEFTNPAGDIAENIFHGLVPAEMQTLVSTFSSDLTAVIQSAEAEIDASNELARTKML
jgi:hypothetical protein